MSRTECYVLRTILEANFPHSCIKSSDSHGAVLKKSNKHHAIAPQIHQVLIFAMNLKQNAFTSRIFSDEADEPEMVAATAARSLPSTRAGGQDDGSLTNSLK